MSKFIRYFSVVTIFFSYIMLLMGAIVTKTGSGQGCGNSWPFCHGQLIPKNISLATFIEYSHRITSGIGGLFILLLFLLVWLKLKRDKTAKILSSISLFFVIFQGILGALTVVYKGTFSYKYFLAFHFGFSLISFAATVLLTLYLYRPNKKINLNRMSTIYLWFLLIYSYVVIYTGALVRHTNATMGCGFDFPLCNNVFPNLISQAGVQLLHRLAAFSLFVLLIIFSLYILKKHPDLKKHMIFLITMIISQIISGILTIFSGGQLIFALLHTTFICFFFSSLSYLAMKNFLSENN